MYFQVIMPVGTDPDRREKEAIIRAVASSEGLASYFPSYASHNPVFNLQSSLRDLRGADFVLADLSLERPSCYYELGLAEALGKPAYLLAREGTTIHQTAARHSVRFFDSLKDFRVAIEEIINQAVRGGGTAAPTAQADD
jgi:nucleoside 2-deoxyribosyltransferase